MCADNLLLFEEKAIASRLVSDGGSAMAEYSRLSLWHAAAFRSCFRGPYHPRMISLEHVFQIGEMLQTIGWL